MTIRKRIALLLACLSLCLACIPDHASAAARMTYIASAEQDFYIEDNIGFIYSKVIGDLSAATRCEVTVELQERSLLFFWSEVGSWSSEEDNWWTELSVRAAVTSGTTYRVVTTVTVWSGTQSETQTLTSDSIKAP